MYPCNQNGLPQNIWSMLSKWCIWKYLRNMKGHYVETFMGDWRGHWLKQKIPCASVFAITHEQLWILCWNFQVILNAMWTKSNYTMSIQVIKTLYLECLRNSEGIKLKFAGNIEEDAQRDQNSVCAHRVSKGRICYVSGTAMGIN